MKLPTGSRFFSQEIALSEFCYLQGKVVFRPQWIIYLFVYLLFIYLFICMCICVCTHVEVRGQSSGVDSLLSP